MERPDHARRFSLPASLTLLAIVATLPSLPGIGSFFVGDDFDFLVRMERMDGALSAFTMSFWGEWEPLWYLGFYRDWALWGLDPTGYHVASLLWLVLGVWALFALVRELWPDSEIAPWAAALLFATHPLHDEAVTYLAARGHPMATGLAVVALWAWFRRRRSERPWLWIAGSWGAALLAAMGKETALMLPAWAAGLEWCVERGMRLRRADLLRSARTFALFFVPVVSYFVLRWLAVGLGSDKLRGSGDGPLDAVRAAIERIPQYALAGGLPLPFAFVDEPLIEMLMPLGWLVAALALLPALIALAAAWRAGRPVTLATGLWVAGLAIVLVALFPVFWTDLALRRRYFFTPSVGAVLMAAVAFHWLACRRRRVAWALLLLLTVGGGVGLFERNRLYQRAGNVTREFLTTVAPSVNDERRVALITLPRYVGGDGFSGAYVLHTSDALSAMRLAGGRPAGFSYGVKAYFVDDYSAELELEEGGGTELTVTFRDEAAYAAARSRGAEGRGGLPIAVIEADDAARRMRYELALPESFLADGDNELYLFTDGRFRRVRR